MKHDTTTIAEDDRLRRAALADLQDQAVARYEQDASLEGRTPSNLARSAIRRRVRFDAWDQMHHPLTRQAHEAGTAFEEGVAAHKGSKLSEYATGLRDRLRALATGATPASAV